MAMSEQAEVYDINAYRSSARAGRCSRAIANFAGVLREGAGAHVDQGLAAAGPRIRVAQPRRLADGAGWGRGI